MNPVTRDFIRRWNWLLLIQFAATTVSWILHAKGGKLHFEMLPAVALSMDLTRGLVRFCLGLPLSRRGLARGLWLAVAALGPLMTLGSMGIASLCCLLFGLPLPRPELLTYHFTISIILAGTMQFLLTSLPVRPAPTLPGRIREIVLGMLWGLGISATVWISFVIPSGWDSLRLRDQIVLGLLLLLSAASWFTTRSMLDQRAGAGPVSPAAAPTRPAKSSLSGPGGWRLWFGQELNGLAFISILSLFFIAISEGIAWATGAGVGTAMRGTANAYLNPGIMCSMIIIPLLARAVAPARAFQAMPVNSGQHALLLAARPVVTCLWLFFVFTGVSSLIGRPVGQAGRAFCFFFLIGSMMGLMQAITVRNPTVPAAMGMGILLAPAAIVSIPLLLQAEKPVAWMAFLGMALFLVSWLLHRRWLRTSSRLYRNHGWLSLFTGGQLR